LGNFFITILSELVNSKNNHGGKICTLDLQVMSPESLQAENLSVTKEKSARFQRARRLPAIIVFL
jgi:hypothetical protein